MTTFKAYLLFVFLPNISNILGIIGGLAFAACLLLVFLAVVNEEKVPAKVLKIWAISLVVLFIGSAIPSKKDLLTIYATKYLTAKKQQKIINEIPDVVLKYLKRYLKEKEIRKN